MTCLMKEQVSPYFEKWTSMKDTIEELYDERSERAIELMTIAIDNYAELLEYGGKEINERTGKCEYVFLPLNGEERFDFIRTRIKSHYAHVQLDMLYTEVNKKIARILVMQERERAK